MLEGEYPQTLSWIVLADNFLVCNVTQVRVWFDHRLQSDALLEND